MSDDSQKPVTVVATSVVRPSKKDEFTRWADEVDSAAARLDGPLSGVCLHDAQG
jgi:antibiotic biosynthesis monooxygenase (ABM) superfamily enzyme